MTGTAAPDVVCEQLHPDMPVSDVLAAVDFYTTKLGFTLAFTWGEPASLAGVNLGNVQLFLKQGEPNPKGWCVYFVVADADELYAYQCANGVDVMLPPEDREYGLRDYRVRDLMAMSSRSDTICPTPGLQSRSSGWMFRCAWKSVSPHCWLTWPSTSA